MKKQNKETDFTVNILRTIVGGMYYEEIKAEMEKELAPENKEEMTEILLIHLRMEFLLDRILRDHYKDLNDLEDAKLTFFQKVRILPISAMHINSFIEPIIELNRIRNQYVHNLKFSPQEKNIKEIKKYLESINYVMDKIPAKPIDFIRAFVNIAEFALLLETTLLDEKLKKIKSQA